LRSEGEESEEKSPHEAQIGLCFRDKLSTREPKRAGKKIVTLKDETDKHAGIDPRRTLPVCAPGRHLFVGYVSGRCCCRCGSLEK
tara:strand:+ start:167 stop:421 length:255 start_codon:yes stop_codon:yes gene_type:complete